MPVLHGYLTRWSGDVFFGTAANSAVSEDIGRLAQVDMK
jgi:hypothetical protein